MDTLVQTLLENPTQAVSSMIAVGGLLISGWTAWANRKKTEADAEQSVAATASELADAYSKFTADIYQDRDRQAQRIVVLEKRLGSVEGELAARNDELRALEDEIESLRSTVEVRDEELARLRAEMKHLRERIRELETERNEWREKYLAIKKKPPQIPDDK